MQFHVAVYLLCDLSNVNFCHGPTGNSIFSPWTPLGTSVPQNSSFVPPSKFLATALLMTVYIS